MAFMDTFSQHNPQLSQQLPPQQETQQLKQMVSSLRGILKGDPWALIDSLSSQNPQIAEIVGKYRAMTPQQAYQSIGYDLNQISSLIDS